MSPTACRQSYVYNIKPYDYNSLEIDSINGHLYTANGYTYQLTQSYGGRFSYCKIAVFGSAVKNRVLPTRPTFLATKPQVTQVQRAVCSEVRSFSPHFRNPSPRKASARPFTQHVSSKKWWQPVRLPPFCLISSPKQVGYFLMQRPRRFATDATASSLTESQAREGLRADDVGRTVRSHPSLMLLHTESTVRALSAMVPTPEDFIRNSKS